MKCEEIRLTEVCESYPVADIAANCPTAPNEGSTITYYTPPNNIFVLNPSKNHIGERVICVEDNNNDSEIKAGEIFTVIDQTNEQFGYIRLDKFKDQPLKWFSPGRFRKLKAIYDGIEYTLAMNR